VQRDQLFEVIGALGAMRRLASGKAVSLGIVGVPDVVRARQQDEALPVVDQAAHRDAAEPDPVVALLPTDQPGSLPLAAGAMVGERDLERGVHRLRP